MRLAGQLRRFRVRLSLQRLVHRRGQTGINAFDLAVEAVLVGEQALVQLLALRSICAIIACI